MGVAGGSCVVGDTVGVKCVVCGCICFYRHGLIYDRVFKWVSGSEIASGVQIMNVHL